MQGKIIKGIAGFYYVQTEDKLYECKAKGIFRNKKMKPLVGDNVEIDILDEEDQEGNITKIYERSNELIRPAVANVNQALIIFAAKNPKPNYNLLDGETGSTCDRLLQQSGSCKRTRSDIVRKSI